MTPNQRKSVALSLAASIALGAEGLRQYAYYDPPGILTVCYGHTGADVVKGKKYPLEACKAFFNADMLKAIDIVDKCQPGLEPHVLAAFADAVFNMGPTIACSTKGSTAARMLRAGNIEGACNQLPRWNNARIAGVAVPLPGLTKRRQLEQQLCLGY